MPPGERSRALKFDISTLSTSATVLVHTFDGLSIQCMVGQCRHTLSLPEVFFEARGKVMEMVEHYPSQGKPAKLPIIRCERPLSRIGA